MTNGSGPRADEGRLLELLRILEDRHRHSHETIWEVEKHFTWWIYVTFGAIGAVILTDELNGRDQSLIILLLGVVGLVMSLLGYNVLRLESIYFNELRDIWKRIYFELNRTPGFGYVNAQIPGIDLRTILPNHYFLEVPQNVSGQMQRRIGVRRAFQIMMAAAGAVFLVVIGFALHAILS